jgi:hypothetical protein
VVFWHTGGLVGAVSAFLTAGIDRDAGAAIAARPDGRRP